MSVKVTSESPPDEWSNCPKVVEASDKMGSLLWAESKYKDFEIIIGDRVLPVHKCVLDARSPVLATLLTSPEFTEITTYQIQHFDYDTVKTAIQFFYTGEVFGLNSAGSEISTSIICEILKFGHMYEVQHLIWACLPLIKAQKNNFNNPQRKAIISSVFDTGLEKVINSILGIFGPIEGDFDFDMPNYPALGDVMLVQDDSFKDMKIICDDGTAFLIHKCILALRSPIFGQMIEEMDKNGDISGQLKIDRVKPTVFEKVIEFFYTGCITNEAFDKDPDLLLGLEELADRFKVEELVIFCQVEKMSLLSTSTPIEVKVKVMEIKDLRPKAADGELSTSWPWWIYPSEDLGTFLWANSGVKFLDKFRFQIITDQVGGVLHVDRCVLAARSPILAKILTSQVQSGQLKIADFSFDIVQDAITFCYYNQLFDPSIKPSYSWVWNLLKFGQKYDIYHLVEACLDQIRTWRWAYSTDERKFLIKSALDLQGSGDSDQKIVDSILSIFGAIEGAVLGPKNYKYKYLTLGDALLVQNDSFKDLKIICDDDDGTEQQFSVHKFVLALKSPVLSQIFEKMDGDNSGQLKITQFKPIVCANAVQFFYSGIIPHEFGTFDRNQDLFLGLLKFADKYKVEQLASLILQKIDDDKERLNENGIDLCIETATDLRSSKILNFILGIFGAHGVDQEDFDIEKASKESYWD